MGRERLLAIVSVTLVAGFAYFHLSQPAWLTYLYLQLSGKSACSREEVNQTLAHLRRLSEAYRSWEQSSQLVMSEAQIELWAQAGESWWMPRSSRPKIGWVIGEMAADFYGGKDNSVRPGDVVLDCGADIGVFTRQALKRGASLVVAIEPFPDKEPCLRRNFEKEIQQNRVVVVPKGVWDRDSELEIFGDSVVERRTEQGIRVPLTTIDAIVRELNLTRVDFIKMDIEGSEPNALRGASETIRKFRPRIVLATEHTADDYESLPKLIREIEPRYSTMRCIVCGSMFGKIRPISLAMDAR